MIIDATVILNRLLDRADLTENEAGDLMQLLTDEALPQAMSGALLIALRAKGETADEVRGFAKRDAQTGSTAGTRIPAGIVAADIVGTGGDGSGSLNISTGTALLAAGCGVPIVKHGNRSVSSKSGSADVLEAMGVPLPEDPERVDAPVCPSVDSRILVCAVFPSGDEGDRAGTRGDGRAHRVQYSGSADESGDAAV